jgi:hypothetical protein
LSIIKVNTIQNANGTTALTFAANGQMTLANTPLQLTGGQIQFPGTQIASADANTLDDYEEGTWTPIIGGSGGQSGQSYSGQAGYYTKTGRVVTVTFRVVLTTKGTITNDPVIGGLPFTSQNSVFYGGGVCLWSGLATSWTYVYFKVAPNTTYAIIEGTKSAVDTSITATTSDIGNSSQFNGSFTYFV